jgi:hypothetical protein
MRAYTTIAGIVLITVLVADAQIQFDGLREGILGEWSYQNSILTAMDSLITVETGTLCPVFRIVYDTCNDENLMKGFPSAVIEMRKNNPLSDICSRTLDLSGDTVDTFFPVVRVSDDSTSLYVQLYGKRYKHYYRISKLDNETMVIEECACVMVDARCLEAQHVYKKEQERCPNAPSNKAKTSAQ